MTATDTTAFTQNEAQVLWTDYMHQVENLCDSLSARQKADIVLEIKAHLLESFIQLDCGDEASRISTAIGRLGEPSEFVPLWVEERLLDGAQPGASTRNLFQLLKRNALKGSQQFAFSMAVGFGYLLSFYFFLVAVLKLVFPENIGLFLTPSGMPILGYVDVDEFTEVMGLWLTPVGLASAVLLQFVLGSLVNRWVGRFAK